MSQEPTTQKTAMPGQNPVAVCSFKVVGIVTSVEFQRCKTYVDRLHRCFPAVFLKPEIRPMLSVSWAEYLLKTKRTMKIRDDKMVVVLVNGEYLGNDDDLLAFVSELYDLHIDKDFRQEGIDQLVNMIEDSHRTHVYMMISIDGANIGSLLFQLYNDIVPQTCENFVKLCTRKTHGYKGAPIHRIACPSWLQGGGYDLKGSKRLDNENYNVQHNRRGVLSMCHNGKNVDNSTQFMISLSPTPWMDSLFVAFGQLIEGEKVLQTIESVPTRYEAPLKPIIIEDCGLFTLYAEPDREFLKQYEAVKLFGRTTDDNERFASYMDLRDVPSELNIYRYLAGLYCLEPDANDQNADLKAGSEYALGSVEEAESASDVGKVEDLIDFDMANAMGSSNTNSQIRMKPIAAYKPMIPDPDPCVADSQIRLIKETGRSRKPEGKPKQSLESLRDVKRIDVTCP